MSALSIETVVARLLMARDYDAALATVTESPAGHPQRDALLRMVYARMGRFAEAAAAGRRYLDHPACTNEDRYRQAQILLWIDAVDEAFEVGLAALTASPEDWRLLVPVVEAVLRRPALRDAFSDAAGPIAALYPRVHPDRPLGSRDLCVPSLLPHYAHLEGGHPIFRAMVRSITAVGVYWPESYGPGLVATALDALPRAERAMAAFMAADPLIDQASAARYVATRFPSLLFDDQGCAVDFLLHAPITLGERPFFVVFDTEVCLFQPFCPTEHMALPQNAPGIYRILRHQLESPRCLGILTHYHDAARRLGEVFDSTVIRDKCHFVNPPSSADSPIAQPIVPPPAVRGRSDLLTMLFPTSADARTEIFYMRGGVDVLNAFAAAHLEHPCLRLIVRGPLPDNLSPRLKTLVERHPAIEWLPDHMPWSEYEQILRRADLVVVPSVVTFRNGLAQALNWGLVPIVSDGCYNTEVVEHGVAGLVVEGRRDLAHEIADPPGFVTDWRALYQARDLPMDRDFCDRLTAAMAQVAIDRSLVARISEHNLTVRSQHLMSQGDVDRLNQLVLRGVSSN